MVRVRDVFSVSWRRRQRDEAGAGEVHIVFPHLHQAHRPDHGGKDPIPNFVFLSTPVVHFSVLDATLFNPGKRLDKYTLIKSMCMSKRSCVSRCNRSNSQVFKRIVQVALSYRREKRGLGSSSLRPERACGWLLRSIWSSCVVEKTSLFTSMGSNVTAH